MKSRQPERLLSWLGAALKRLAGQIAFPIELLTGSAYSVLGSGALRVAQVCGAVLLARVLSQSDFGQVSLVQSTLIVFVSVGAMGGGAMGTRLVAERRRTGGRGLGSAITLSILLSATGGFLASLGVAYNAAGLCRSISQGDQLIPLIQIGSLYILFYALNDAAMGVLRGFQDFRPIAINQAVQAATMIAAYAVFVPFWGAKGALVALVVSAVVSVLAAGRCIRRGWISNSAVLKWRDLWPDLRMVWHFGIPTMLSAIIAAPAIWLVNASLARSSRGYAAVALLNASAAVRMLLLFVPLLVAQAVFPFAMDAVKHDPKRFDRYMCFVHAFIVLPLHAGSLALSYFAAPLMLVFGKSYKYGSETLMWLLLSVAIQAFGSTSGIALQCSRLLWIGFLMNGVWAAGLVFTTRALVEPMGAPAAALGYVLGYAVLVAGQTWLLRKRLPAGMARASILGVLLDLGVAATWIAAGVGTRWGRLAVALALVGTYFLRVRTLPEHGVGGQVVDADKEGTTLVSCLK